jgi:regulator of Ty1 transposition protein 109
LTVAFNPDHNASTQSASGDEGGSGSGLLVYAIEILVYTTIGLTTLFVSKADSTGYLHLAKPLGSPSPFKVISTTFLSHLVDARQRSGIKLVVSLFARAQDQYLFPGSVENSGKHVLDDTRLIKWWCGVLDPVLRESLTEPKDKALSGSEERDENAKIAKGYLVVPGFDKYETMPLLPSSVKTDPPNDKRWANGHPLLQISNTSDAPPRCLIPRFPDDPKARYLDELDDEIAESYGAQVRSTDVDYKDLGRWKSVQSLDQFWEMMAFRQECSAGRMVGFIWVVFDPVQQPATGNGNTTTESWLPQATNINKGVIKENVVTYPHQLQTRDLPYVSQKPGLVHTGSHEQLSANSPFSLSQAGGSVNRPTSPLSVTGSGGRKTRKLTGPIYTRQPRVKVSSSRSASSSLPSHTPFYTWPIGSRGEIVLDEKEYRRVNDLLLRLDFSDETLARGSTKRYIDEVSVIAGLEGRQRTWGDVVVGRKDIMSTSEERANFLSVVGKANASCEETSTPINSDRAPNILGGGLVRKRPKLSESEGLATNLLGGALVRKKPKA